MPSYPRAFLIAASALLCAAEVPSGWKVIHDKTSACQIAIPGDWKALEQTTWIGEAPAHQGSVQLVSQSGRPAKPLSEMAQKALTVDKLIENTPQRVFYATKPSKSAHPLTPYRAVVPAPNGTCTALFSVRAEVTEDTVKKIVMTLSPAH